MEDAITVIATTMALMLLMSYSVLMRGLKLQSYKDRLSMVRERWFDLALDDKSSLEFDSPEYRSLADFVEDMMDFAAALSVLTIFWMWVTKKLGIQRRGGIETTMEWENIRDPYTRNEARRILWLLDWSLTSYLRSLSLGYVLWTDLAQLLVEQPDHSIEIDIRRLIPV